MSFLSPPARRLCQNWGNSLKSRTRRSRPQKRNALTKKIKRLTHYGRNYEGVFDNNWGLDEVPRRTVGARRSCSSHLQSSLAASPLLWFADPDVHSGVLPVVQATRADWGLLRLYVTPRTCDGEDEDMPQIQNVVIRGTAFTMCLGKKKKATKCFVQLMFTSHSWDHACSQTVV